MDNEPEIEAASFREVYEKEWAEIRQRREAVGFQSEDSGDDSPACPPRNLTGLALSGGGIRSATFCLGLLQGLHNQRLLRIFDYLSTVSGGGYVGGWWSAWLSREEQVKPLRPEDIKDPEGLIQRVRETEDEVSTALRNHLEPNTLKLICDYREDSPQPDRDKLIKEIVRELNRAIGELSPEKYARWIKGLLLEETKPLEVHKEIFPPEEKIESERPPQGATETRQREAEGSSSAWTDPLHHLRLFASYLTPRRGALSADTWRAVSVITRNLALTWLVLLPVLMVIVLCGQLYFKVAPELLKLVLGQHAIESSILKGPFIYLLLPIIILLSLIAIIAIIWLIDSPDRLTIDGAIVHLLCIGAAVFLLTTGLIAYIQQSSLTSLLKGGIGAWWWLLLLIPGLLVLMVIWPPSVRGLPNEKPELKRELKRQIRQNRLSRVHTRLMTWLVLIFIILLISGYGHSIAEEISHYKALRLLPAILAIAGSIFTAFKASPSGGGDTETREPSLMSRIVFAVTPGLMVILLAIGAAWLGDEVLLRITDEGIYQVIRPVVTIAIMCGILLCFALALYEMDWFKLRLTLGSSVFFCFAVFSFYWAAKEVIKFSQDKGLQLLGFMRIGDKGVLLIPLAVAAVIPLIFFVRVLGKGKWKHGISNLVESHKRPRQLIFSLLPIICYASIFVTAFVLYQRNKDDWGLPKEIYPMMTIVAALTGSMILFRMFVIRKDDSAYFKLKPKWRRSKVEKVSETLWGLASLCLAVPVLIGYVLHTATHPSEPKEVLGAFIVFLVALAFLPYLLLFLRSLADAHVGTYIRPQQESSQVEEGEGAKKSGDPGFFAKGLGLLTSEPNKENASRMFVCVVIGAMLTIGYGVTAIKQTSNTQYSALSPTITVPALITALIFAIMLGLVIFGLSAIRVPEGQATQWSIPGAGAVASHQEHSKVSIWLLSLLCVVAAVWVGFLSNQILMHIKQMMTGDSPGHRLARLALAGLFTCFTITGFEIWWGKGNNRRSLWLLACNYITLSVLFLVGLNTTRPYPEIPGVIGLLTVLGLLAAALVWVVALGWMVDPNMVSMHQFYKARLVRAYLGASNARRFYQNKDIAEAVAGDDVRLQELKNCQKGGPYHLINTTLNLVAGRDLATAQRSASSFVLSKGYCGSPRTSYRPTDKYMDGQLTLGTAVAASGAAVSPSMGAKKPTAALAMLMTLLNVRLGYWAPTPNKEKWKFAQPRLWPFYLLREFLSQTNDLSAYCYLTDGGHFDNTGLYSLVERGCRFIVMVDCAADPKPCFQDLGDAIRRCRIDFGAEIDLDIEPLLKTREKGEVKKETKSFIIGTIQYSRKHAETLCLQAPKNGEGEKARTGIIIYFKPSISGKETADVRQYAIENNNFPQQATTNQWFDEAQFESYRRLGQLYATKAFGELKSSRKVKGDADLSPADVEKIFQEADRKFATKTEFRGVIGPYL